MKDHNRRLQNDASHRTGSAIAWAVLFGVAPVFCIGVQARQGAAPINEAALPVRQAWLISVPLPITESVAAQINQQISRIAGEATAVVAADQRPVMVLEFDTSSSATGQGSNLGSCLDIAMLLTDSRMQGIQSVAYIPRSRGAHIENEDGLPSSRLQGHAVLVALACNEIAMHEDSAIGRAGADIRGDTALEAAVYRNIAGRRQSIPLPVVIAMVDSSRELHQVETEDGVVFADQDELARLDTAGRVINSTTLGKGGELPVFTSRSLQQMQLVRLRVGTREDLAARLKIDPASIEGNPAAGGEWHSAQLPLGNFVDSREVEWSLRMLNNHLNTHPETNLIVVRFNCPGGEMDACLRLARVLAELDSARIRTVAFIETAAGGSASLIATACDQIIMADAATLGGPDIAAPGANALADSRPLIKLVAESVPRDWSVPMGLVDPDLDVMKYRNRVTGEIRLLCEEERLLMADSDQWVSMGGVDLTSPLKAGEALDLALARSTVTDFDQFRKFFQLSESPVELEPSKTDVWIENFARFMATPMIAAWLLFGAVFLLSTEMSNPGIGLPGFLGSLCLMLFFWSQYLDGNANWLEILLFGVGAVFIVLEVFVLPGFGVFGVGGLILIVVSIVLASQTFIFPRNSEELARMPVSLSMVLAASGGFFAAVFFLRKYVTTLPILRRIMLDPRSNDESISPALRDQKEALAKRDHLLRRTGKTTTPLVPAGKAQIGNELVDVITDGRMVERGTLIRVVQVLGNRVIVEPETSEPLVS